MNPIATVRQLWNDPKKRPWVLGGAGAAAGVAYLTLKRPTDPDEAAEDDRAAATSSPTAADGGAIEGPATYGDAGIVGALPIVVGGSGYGTPDAAFQEMDLTGVYSEIDAIAVGMQDNLDAIAVENATLRRDARRAGRVAGRAQNRNAKQQATIKKQKQQIRKTKQRVRRVERKVERVTSRRPPRKRRR